MATWPNRLSHRRCRHARALAHRRDAQPRPHGGGVLPGQASADRLARGEQWFWDTLVDADPGSNPANWQWVAGSGADAAPYFRIFNPVLQGEKFDPDGAYVRRWVPELARFPASVIHRPWSATSFELRAAGVELGKTYPAPIIDHKSGRERALAAYERIRGG